MKSFIVLACLVALCAAVPAPEPHLVPAWPAWGSPYLAGPSPFLPRTVVTGPNFIHGAGPWGPSRLVAPGVVATHPWLW